MKTLTKQSGFSLVELMVVVAIIGVLATVAIPRVNKFIAKARTSEAQVNLGQIHMLEKNTFTEFTGYSTYLGLIGFFPEGRMRYNIGFTAATEPADYVTLKGTSYSATTLPKALNTKAACASTPDTNYKCSLLNGASGSVPPDLATGIYLASASTFLAGARAVISTGGVDDVWQMDENKNLTNPSDGTN